MPPAAGSPVPATPSAPVTTAAPGVVGKLGLAGRLASAGGRVTSLAGTGASMVGNAARAIPVLGRGSAGMAKALSASKSAVGAARNKVDTFVGKAGSCLHSFSPATLVLTAAGAVAIGSLGVGDHVLAYDETTGTTASYPISVVHINADPETGTVVVGGETIETTPGHPFYTLEAGWLDAASLEPGMHVPSASGEPGEVSSVDFAARPAIMYNLTVEVAHTFFVGEGEWLVHNTGPCGAYSKVGGHHPHAQAAFRTHPKYTPRKAFAVSDEALRDLGTTHARVTKSQAQLMAELRRSGRRNTMGDQTRIAWQSMHRAGVDKAVARSIARHSAKTLRAMGVHYPTRVSGTRIDRL